ncbi:MAG TPA: hypothetical protein VHD81_03310 [Mycobacteriales bacterium]|nr:hypothetical protein [Mycobacteriales bacterium]
MRTRAALALLALGAGALAGASASAAVTTSRSCAWQVEVDPDGANVAFPDQAARYWVLREPGTSLDSLTIHGYYPFARYTSLTSYNATLGSTDGIPDVRINPDKGSVNPFRTGAPRLLPAAKRRYTVRVLFGRRPAHPPANTIYTEPTDGSRRGTDFSVALRIYEPNRGLGDDGGVPLPSVTLDTPAGAIPIPDCPIPPLPAGANATVNRVPAVHTGPGSQDPIVWHKFYNLPTSFTTALAAPLVPLTMALPKGGFGDNPDNKYVATVVSMERAPAVVITGTLPRTPATWNGEARMQPGQLRYWSICTNEVVTQRFYGCVMDDQIPLAAGRRYTIVASPVNLRPANATRRCGIQWLPAGAAPDTVLIERNMLPDPSFRHSVQLARYGHEQHDLGRYYPLAYYRTLAEVSRLGCHRPVNHPRPQTAP